MTIGERIKQQRNKAGLSQAALGEILQITQQAVGRWEKGMAEPDSENLIAMSKLFNISIDYLLGCDEISPEERAAGARETIKKSITPIQDDMLYVFDQIGKRFGEQAQRDYITVGENMLKLKH